MLRQFIALRVECQRQMDIVRRLPAKMLIKRYLPHRRLDKIGAADDFADALKMIVHYHRQIIGEQPIAAVDNEIFPRQRLIGDDRAAQSVIKFEDRTRLPQTQSGVFRAEA